MLIDSPISFDNSSLVSALLDGDESVFLALVDHFQTPMLHICLIFVGDLEIAQEVVQDTWLDMWKGLDHFEGRSSLKTWLYKILTNKAKTRGKRESRSIPFSNFDAESGEAEITINPQRFLPSRNWWVDHWTVEPQPLGNTIEEAVLSKELHDYVEAAINRLPESQRVVISMRDIEGWGSEEVCNLLGLTETNQRVLLHRARSKVRRALERYFEQKLVQE